MKNCGLLLIPIMALIFQSTSAQNQNNVSQSASELIQLFNDWRSFEQPPLQNGIPDYSQTSFDKRWPQFQALKTRLENLPKEQWPTRQQIDWHILWAEMNGYIFNYKVLKSWERDPAFYKSIWTDQSDVPAHEGPTHHAVTEVWQYSFPLDQASSMG